MGKGKKPDVMKALEIDYATHVATAENVIYDTPAAYRVPSPTTGFLAPVMPNSPGARLIGTVTVDDQPAYEFTVPGNGEYTVWVSEGSYLPL